MSWSANSVGSIISPPCREVSATATLANCAGWYPAGIWDCLADGKDAVVADGFAEPTAPASNRHGARRMDARRMEEAM
jgi:hypothetical protein